MKKEGIKKSEINIKSLIDLKEIYFKLKFDKKLEEEDLKTIRSNYTIMYKEKYNKEEEVKGESLKIEELLGLNEEEKKNMN